MRDSRDIRTQLGAARTRLILERPFIGALVMHLPLVAADPRWCESVATDARAIYFNADYIAGLDLAQTQFVLAHEAMHCALGHFARRSHRTRRRWDVACDHAVNLLLADEGLKPPPAALIHPGFRGLSAEEIYPLIPADTAERTLDRHLFDAQATGSASGYRRGASEGAATGAGDPYGAGSPPGADEWNDAGNEPPDRHAGVTRQFRELGPSERAEAARRWQGRVAAAAQRVHRAGRLPDSWLRVIDGYIQPQLPWRQLLARYLRGAARDDYSFQRLSRRGGDALMPRLAGGEMDLHVALDTSGSIGSEELAQFAAEVDALKGQIRARVTLHACDERLDARGPWAFEAWEAIELPSGLGGGGGTAFAPVFDWIAAQRRPPDLLLYFTDAEGEFPRCAPDYPVIWLVKGRAGVPWGERIQLN